MNQLMIL